MWRFGSLFVVLAACSPGDLRTAYQLRNVDAFSTEANALRVAGEVPNQFEPRGEDVEMTGIIRIDGGLPQTHRFALVPSEFGALEKGLSTRTAKDANLHVYKLSSESLPAFNAFRNVARLAEDDEHDAPGSLSVSSPVCRKTAELPARIPVTVYLKVVEVNHYVRLVNAEDVLEGVNPDALQTAAPRC
ncbi:MAG: hypothetical protein ABJL99_18335 [Aliishimia sp.]